MSSVTVVPPADDAEARAALLERTYRAAAPVLEPWFGERVLRETLARELDNTLNVVSTPHPRSDAAHRRIDAVRLLQCSSAPPRWFVAQAQLLDQSRPTAMVTITYRSFDVANEGDVHAIMDAARAGLADVIGDRAVTISVRRFESTTDPLPNADRIETTFVAAPIRRLHLPEPHRSASVRAVVPESMNFYEQYEAWYREFWSQRPELMHQVPIETAEDLEACIKHDGLRLIALDEEICGLLAAIPKVELGMKGWRIREKVIAPSFWGRGLSAPATVAFAQSLPAAQDDALWGTIVPGNRASMQSARLIGREPVGSVCRVI